MENVQYAKNGQLVMAVKSYEELTSEEKQVLHLPYGNSLDDYANFQVRYNKKGELLGVQAHDFSERKSEEIKEQSQRLDLLDGLQVLFSKNKHSKAYQQAKKRLDVSNEQINEARQVVNRG